MAAKINASNGASAKLQARHELAKLERIETDELNENDVRIVAGDTVSRWARPKDTDDLVAEWNEANPA